MPEMVVPFAIDATGGIAKTSDPATLTRQHLLTYIATYPGERIMRPDFGTPLSDLVFETGGTMQLELLRGEVQDAVARDVSDVTLNAFTISGSDADGSVGQDGTLTISLRYSQKVGSAAGAMQTADLTVGA